MIKARIDKISLELSNWLAAIRFIILPWLVAQWNGRLLEHKGGPAKPAAPRELTAVVPFYGSDRLLAAFLDHHRRLGVDAFAFLDLSPNGDLSERLAGQSDCAVWRPRGEPDPTKAIYWLNYLRWRYATGRWCLSLEPTDWFVFPRSETRQIRDLIDFLETERRNHIYALVVEMYGDRPDSALSLKSGEHPLTALPYFDPYGYTTAMRPGRFRNVVVRGGVQRRTLFRDSPRRTPALNRIPLVKWRWFYAYVAGTRLMMPRRLNPPHSPWHSSPTAGLLRFALLDDDGALRRAAKAEAGEIISDGGGRSYARVPELRNVVARQDCSELFTSSWDLVDCGLLNPGQWF